MLNLIPDMTDVVLSYLSFEDLLCLRLVSKTFRDKLVPQFTHDLIISKPNEDFKNTLRNNPDWVISHYKKFKKVNNLRFTNLEILDNSLLNVFFL